MVMFLLAPLILFTGGGVLCPRDSLSGGVSIQGVSVQGALCPGVLCPGGLCQGDPQEETWDQRQRSP